MPIGIDTEAKGFVSLGIIGGETSLVEQQGGTMRSTDVQTHARRVATIEAVAVDATLELSILDERRLLEGGEVALVDAHLAPHFVAWLDETIAQAVVDAVGAHIKVEWLVSMPTIGELGRNGDVERFAYILRHELVPTVDVETRGLASLTMQRVALVVGNDGIDQQGIVALHAEVERSNADGDGHIHVVGIDVGQRGIIRCIADTLGAGGKKEEGRG